ncbi:hypothetical protein V4C53_38870 [Paraburkholderia azotifigens]|uniref:hypothetical protein n=1 Tax=Paraburkholderia azotifigens TaxID=2057004 RepID=UPI00317D2077
MHLDVQLQGGEHILAIDECDADFGRRTVHDKFALLLPLWAFTIIILESVSDRLRARLVCYLVVAQLYARADTGAWLRTDHLVESAQGRCAYNRVSLSWLDRCNAGVTAIEIAARLNRYYALQSVTRLATLFSGSWQLDYSSPIIDAIHRLCEARIRLHQIR